MNAGKPATKPNGAGKKAAADDPFATGAWLMITVGGGDMLVCVTDSSEHVVRAELERTGQIHISPTRKYPLRQVSFAARDPKTSLIVPGSVPVVSTHEATVELMHPFPSHMINVSAVTFLSDFHPDDVDRLRQIVRIGDAAMVEKRAAESAAAPARS